jgi:hypothetical protein
VIRHDIYSLFVARAAGTDRSVGVQARENLVATKP